MKCGLSYSSHEALGALLSIGLSLLLAGQASATNSWTFVGPSNAPYSTASMTGRITWLAQHPTIATTVVAAHNAGGLWKSTDSGGSWSCILDGPIGAVAYRASTGGLDPVRLIVGFGTTGGGFYDGIYTKDEPSGQWIRRYQWSEDLGISTKCIAVSSNQQTIYVGTTRGLYRSTNGGVGWTEVLAFQNRGVMDVVASPSASNVALLVAYSPTRVYRTEDSGGTWNEVADADFFPQGELVGGLLAWAPSDPSYLYLVAQGIGSPIPMRMLLSHPALSADVGKSNTWDLKASTTQSADWGLGDGLSAHSAFAVSKADPGYLYLCGLGIARSLTYGATWQKVNSYCANQPDRYHDDVHHVLAFNDGTRNGFLLGTDGGVYFHSYSAGADECSITAYGQNSGLYAMDFEDISVDPHPEYGNLVIGGTQDQGPWGLQPDGEWIDKPGRGDFYNVQLTDTWGPACDTDALSLPVMTALLSRYTGPTSISYMQDNCWADHTQFSSTPLQGPPYSGGPVLSDPTDPSLIYEFGNDAMYTYRYGDPLAIQVLTGLGSIRSAVLVPGATAGDTRIYAGGGLGTVWKITHQSSGYAATAVGAHADWGTANLQYKPGISSVWAAEGTVAGADVILIALGTRTAGGTAGGYSLPNGNLFRKIGAASWSNSVAGNLPRVPLLSLAVNPYSQGQIFVGGIHNIWWTNNDGLTWLPCKYNLPGVPVEDLEYHAGLGALYAGTYGRSIWMAFVYNWQTAGTESADQSPVGLANDGQGKLVKVGREVVFELGRRGHIEMTLFDVQGRLVRRVADGTYSSGRTSLSPSFAGIPHGLYYLRMTLDDRQVDARSLVVGR